MKFDVMPIRLTTTAPSTPAGRQRVRGSRHDRRQDN